MNFKRTRALVITSVGVYRYLAQESLNGEAAERKREAGVCRGRGRGGGLLGGVVAAWRPCGGRVAPTVMKLGAGPGPPGHLTATSAPQGQLPSPTSRGETDSCLPFPPSPSSRPVEFSRCRRKRGFFWAASGFDKGACGLM